MASVNRPGSPYPLVNPTVKRDDIRVERQSGHELIPMVTFSRDAVPRCRQKLVHCVVAMDREIKSFRKTVRQFDKLATKIRAGTLASPSGRRLRRAAMGAFAGLVLIMILVPPFLVPLEGTVTSGFFFRRRPEGFFVLDIETHKGLDIAAPSGTQVSAAAPGVVSATGTNSSFGNYVRVTHMFGFDTYYAHLSEITVDKGRLLIIPALRPIGKVGSTGRSTGPHLHFEIRLFGKALPPRFLLVFHGIRKAIFRF